jgi:fatty acid CoA ligase FadD9
MPAERFRAAVHSARIGGADDIPHLTQALIDKYVADLHLLGLVGPAAETHVA